MSIELNKGKKLLKIIKNLHKIDRVEQNLDDKIVNWINCIGKFSDTDRVYVYFFDQDENGFIIANNTHEYCKKGISSAKDDQQNIPIDLFPFHKHLVYDELQIAKINNINELTKEAKSMKELMEFQGLKSILALPIISKDSAIGFLGFETIRKEKNWTNEHIEALKQVAELIIKNRI